MPVCMHAIYKKRKLAQDLNPPLCTQQENHFAFRFFFCLRNPAFFPLVVLWVGEVRKTSVEVGTTAIGIPMAVVPTQMCKHFPLKAFFFLVGYATVVDIQK